MLKNAPPTVAPVPSGKPGQMRVEISSVELFGANREVFIRHADAV